MDRLRRSYSLKEKCDVVCSIDLLVVNGLLHSQACVALAIPRIYYRRWKKVIAKVGELEKDDSFHAFNMNGLAREIHPGRVGILVAMKEQLLSFICKLRDQGIQCTNRMVMREAVRLVPSFRGKSVTAKEQIVRPFTKHLRLTQRAATHTVQKHYKKPKMRQKTSLP